jgi:hypothetical protein
MISTAGNYVQAKHHADAKCLSESAENGCPLCVLLWDVFSSSEGFSKFVPTGTSQENIPKYPSLQSMLLEYEETKVMVYRFGLAFEQSSNHQNPFYKSTWDLPAAQILVIPVSKDSGDVKTFPQFCAANQIRRRSPSNIPNFKQYGQYIVMDNCKELAAFICGIAFEMQPKHRP